MTLAMSLLKRVEEWRICLFVFIVYCVFMKNKDEGFVYKFLVPILSTMLWGVGLCTGVFGLLPKAVNAEAQFFIAAYSVYVLFIFDTIVEFIDIWAVSCKRHYGGNVFGLFALYALIFVGVIIATFVDVFCYSKEACKLIVVICMILHKCLMAFFNNHHGYFLLDIKGDVFNSNI